MSKWEPDDYDADPVANAVLNVAAAIHRLADATNGLLYGLKYGKETGLSVAEAIEVGVKGAGEEIAGAIRDAVEKNS